MATKNFEKMSYKKLEALYKTASDEDKVAIKAAMDKKQEATEATEQNEATEATEQNEATEATEQNEINLDELVEQLKVNLYHKCRVVPFNTANWVDGYIAGIIKDKRSGKALYAIKTEDNARIVKVHGSKLLEILDETVEISVRTRKRKSSIEEVEWTPEITAEEIEKFIGDVGKTVKIENKQGRIIALIPDKRARRIIYKIEIPAPIDGMPDRIKKIFRVASFGPTIPIAEELDAEGLEINKAYREHREALIKRTPRTLADKYVYAEEALKKAAEKLHKAQDEFELKKQLFERAQEEFNAANNNQEEFNAANNNEESDDEESLA